MTCLKVECSLISELHALKLLLYIVEYSQLNTISLAESDETFSRFTELIPSMQ